MLSSLTRCSLRRIHVGQLAVGGHIAMQKKRAADPTAAAVPEQNKRGKKSSPAKAASDAEQGAAAQQPAAAAAAAGSSGAQQRQFFLMKSEPDVFSIDDLGNKPNQTEAWDGVRNHQAKKVLQSMRLGDQAFFYHSNCKPPGIVGIVEIVREAYPDHTAWDPKGKYHDPSSTEENPKWYMVDCKLVRKLRRPVSLDELKTHKEGALSCMHLFKYGRLSVQAVAPTEWDFVLGLEEQEAPGGGPQGGQGEGKPKGRAKAAGKAAGRGKKAAGEDGAAAAAAAAEDGAAAAAADGEGPAELEQPALANKKKRGRAAK